MRRLALGVLIALAACGGSGSGLPKMTQASCEAIIRDPDGQNTSALIGGCRTSGFDPVWEVKGVYATDEDYDDWRAGHLDPVVEADDTIAAVPEAGSSAGSREPCEHFRNVADDYSKGLMTLDELRTKLQEVHERAKVAAPAVLKASEQMLAAITSGDLESLTASVSLMGTACSAVGY